MLCYGAESSYEVNMKSSFVHAMSESVLSSMWSRVFVYTVVDSILESIVELSRCVRDCCMTVLHCGVESS